MKLQECLSVFLVCSFACICTEYSMYWFRHVLYVFVCICICLRDTSSGGLPASAHLSPPLPDPHITCLLPLTLAILSVFFLFYIAPLTLTILSVFSFFHILKVETFLTTSVLKSTKEKPKTISYSRPPMELLNSHCIIFFAVHYSH